MIVVRDVDNIIDSASKSYPGSKKYNQMVAYKCPCGKGKITQYTTTDALGLSDFSVDIECPDCAKKYYVVNDGTTAWSLDEIK